VDGISPLVCRPVDYDSSFCKIYAVSPEVNVHFTLFIMPSKNTDTLNGNLLSTVLAAESSQLMVS
jgi:hypothetical protein